MRNVRATHARAQLLKLLDSVEAGESITITRRGRPVAQLVPPKAVRAKPPPRPARKHGMVMSEEEILAAANALRTRMG